MLENVKNLYLKQMVKSKVQKYYLQFGLTIEQVENMTMQQILERMDYVIKYLGQYRDKHLEDEITMSEQHNEIEKLNNKFKELDRKYTELQIDNTKLSMHNDRLRTEKTYFTEYKDKYLKSQIEIEVLKEQVKDLEKDYNNVQDEKLKLAIKNQDLNIENKKYKEQDKFKVVKTNNDMIIKRIHDISNVVCYEHERG